MRIGYGLAVLVVVSSVVPAFAAATAEEGLEQFYRVQALADTCGVALSSELRRQFDKDKTHLEALVGYDVATATESYGAIRQKVVAAGEPCLPPDEIEALAQVALYVHDSVLEAREAGPIDVLGGLYITVAVSEYCRIEISPEVAVRLGHDAIAIEASLGIDEAESEAKYLEVLTKIQREAPDCSEGSEDVALMRSVLADYEAAAPLE